MVVVQAFIYQFIFIFFHECFGYECDSVLCFDLAVADSLILTRSCSILLENSLLRRRSCFLGRSPRLTIHMSRVYCECTNYIDNEWPVDPTCFASGVGTGIT